MSLGTSNRDGGKTSESGHLRALAKLVTGDVLSGLVVAQRAAGANMSVDISIGDAFVRRSDGSYAHPVFNDAVYNQVISTADGANPRRDIVVLYLDYSVAPITTVSNNTNGVVQIKVVNGTPAGAPVDPTDVAIQASVGAGNPWTKLARTRVPAAQTSISNTLIDDLRVMTTVDTVDGIHASVTPAANKLVALDGNAKLPSTAIEFSNFGLKIVNFVANTSGLQTITGLGFRPRKVSSSYVGAYSASTIRSGTGVAVKTAAGISQFIYSTSGYTSGTSSEMNNKLDDTQFLGIANSPTGNGFVTAASLTSFDADGITLNVTASAASFNQYRLVFEQ